MSTALLALLLVGCASTVPRFPGPVSWVGRSPSPASDLTDGEETLPWSPAVAEAMEPVPEAADTPAPSHRERRRDDRLGRSVAASAEAFLDRAPSGFRDDCSGFASASLTEGGFAITGSSRSLWEGAVAARATHRRKRPHLGDLAFFDNTYDRDKDARWDDELTHVGVVIAVDEDGTVVLAHAGTSKGRSELRLNLYKPQVHVDDSGEVLNDYLRRPGRGDDDRSRYLAGQLWRAWATPRAEDLNTWRSP